MFESISFHSKDASLAKAWKGLIRRIQTTIEVVRLDNATEVDLLLGTIVALVPGPRRAAPATLESETWCGALEEDCPVGRSAIVRHHNLAAVRFESGSAPVEGRRAFLSQSPGLASSEPTAVVLGTVADASDFSEVSPLARVLLRVR